MVLFYDPCFDSFQKKHVLQKRENLRILVLKRFNFQQVSNLLFIYLFIYLFFEGSIDPYRIENSATFEILNHKLLVRVLDFKPSKK